MLLCFFLSKILQVLTYMGTKYLAVLRMKASRNYQDSPIWEISV
uniref:Receptor-like protein 12 n=1 Tax=Rhizophora mucronata TaxID=61149 RepID=A0A2P2MR30_RHIMU